MEERKTIFKMLRRIKVTITIIIHLRHMLLLLRYKMHMQHRTWQGRYKNKRYRTKFKTHKQTNKTRQKL